MSRSKLLGILLVVGSMSLLIPLAIALAQGDAEGTVTIRDSDDTNFSDLLSDMAIIKLTLPALPTDQVYEGWLVTYDGSRPMSTGRFGSIGEVDTTFVSPDGENLFSVFDKFVISIEPVDDPDPGPSADKPFIHQIPAGGIPHIRHLVFSLGGNPPYAAGNFHAGTPKGLAVGLREQTWIAMVHAGLSANSNTLAQVKQHAEHVVNAIEGSAGANYGDLDGNGATEDFGDGMGVVPYADGTALHAALAASAAPEDDTVRGHSQEAVDSANQASAWALQARDLALVDLASSSLTDARFTMGNAQARLDRALNGFDANNDGAIGRVTGKGGASQAYWGAQDMGMYVFAPATGVGLPDAGDSNVPNLALLIPLVGVGLLLSGAFIYRRSRQRA